MKEHLVIFVFIVLLTANFAWGFYKAWFTPEKLREEIRKKEHIIQYIPLTNFVLAWYEHDSWIWFARILITLGLILAILLLGVTVIVLVQYYFSISF